jgi:ATP-dependent DNA ligase
MDLLAAIKREERKLEKELGNLQHKLNGVRAAAKALGAKTVREVTQVKKRVMSAAARAKISRATKARWAKFRAEKNKKAKAAWQNLKRNCPHRRNTTPGAYLLAVRVLLSTGMRKTMCAQGNWIRLLELPDAANWIWEVKIDGYRAIAVKSEDTVNLFSRTKNSFNSTFPYIRQAWADLPPGTVVDGELVAID